MSEKSNEVCELHATDQVSFKRSVLAFVNIARVAPGVVPQVSLVKPPGSLEYHSEGDGSIYGRAAECARLIVSGQCSQFEYVCPTDIPGADFEIRSRTTGTDQS